MGVAPLEGCIFSLCTVTALAEEWVRSDDEWDGTTKTLMIRESVPGESYYKGGEVQEVQHLVIVFEAGRYIRIENMDSQTLPVDMAGREYDFTDKTKFPVNGIKPTIRSSF